MEPRDLLFFDKMIVPKVIQVLYWVLLVFCVIAGLGVMFTQSFFLGLVVLVVMPLVVRIYSELMMVIFKMNEALQTIKTK